MTYTNQSYASSITQSNTALGSGLISQLNVAIGSGYINQSNLAVGGTCTSQTNIAITGQSTTTCPPVTPPVCKPIAANEYGYMTGDPHFRGGDGELYTITGSSGKVYSIVKDKNFEYDAKFEKLNCWGTTGTTGSAVKVSNSCATKTSIIYYDKTGCAKLVNVVSGKLTETTIQRGVTYTLADGGTVKFGQAYGGGADGSQLEERLIIKSAEGYTLSQVARTGGYIDSNFETGCKGVYSDGVMTSGLLGDTFDAGSAKRVATDNMGTGILNKGLCAYTLGTDLKTVIMQGVTVTPTCNPPVTPPVCPPPVTPPVTPPVCPPPVTPPVCPPPVTPPVCSPIAAKEYGYMTGDPHFRGGDGELYTITGISGKVYSIVKDKNFEYDAKFEKLNCWGTTGTTGSAVKVSSSCSKYTSIIYYDKTGCAKLVNIVNGKKCEITIQRGKVYQLADGGCVKFGQAYGGGADGSQLEERLIIKTKEGYTLSQVARAGGYIDSNFETSCKGVYSDGVMTSGLLGDTFDAGSAKRVATDNMGTGILNSSLCSYTLGTDLKAAIMKGVTLTTGCGLSTSEINGIIQYMSAFDTNSSAYCQSIQTSSSGQNFVSLFTGATA